MMIWPPANAIYRRETYDNYPAAKAMLMQRVRGPAAADGSRARRREQAFRQYPAVEGSRGDDPLALPVDGRTQQGRAPAGQRSADEAQEDRRARRRPDGRRHRLCLGQRRARRRADRPRPGIGRQGQGLFGQGDQLADRQGARQDGRQGGAARPHQGDRRLRGARGLRPRHRGGVRGPRGQGRGDEEGAGRARPRRRLRQQHLDPADHLARRDLAQAREFHRRAFLLAGRQDDARRNHHGREDRREGARHRDGLRPRDQEDADRRQRLPRLLRQPLRHATTWTKPGSWSWRACRRP